MIYSPQDVLGTEPIQRFASDEAYAIAQRIIKNSEEALEKITAAKERIDKAVRPASEGLPF